MTQPRFVGGSPGAPFRVCHVVVLDVVGQTRSIPVALEKALELVQEIVEGSVTVIDAMRSGTVSLFMGESSLIVLFDSEPALPVAFCLEVWEELRELRSLAVRTAIHSGSCEVRTTADRSAHLFGHALTEALELVGTGRAGQILLSDDFATVLGTDQAWGAHIVSGADSVAAPRAKIAATGGFRIEPQHVFFLEPEPLRPSRIVSMLGEALSADGHETRFEDGGDAGFVWAHSIEGRIRSASAVVVVISDETIESEFLQFQLEIAMEARRKTGKPNILPIWLRELPVNSGPFATLSRALQITDAGLDIDAVRSALAVDIQEPEPEQLDLSAREEDEKFYVERPADSDLQRTLNRHESIVLVKGARQIGKTLLIGRGIDYVRERGWRFASTDFQRLSRRQLDSEADFYRVVAGTLAQSQQFEYDFDREWLDFVSTNMNMDAFVRALLTSEDRPFVWFIDEADRIFGSPFASEFYGLIRSWHNLRASERRGPWFKLSVVIGYATEAHLFIEDLNQSPFNVGWPLQLDMFTLENTSDLNQRYGRTLTDPNDVRKLHTLVEGHPFLTRRALDLLARGRFTPTALFASADADDGPFGDHLKRVMMAVSQLPFVLEALTQAMSAPDGPESEGLHRLVSAGILVRTSDRRYAPSCELYRRFLARHLAASMGY